MSYFRNHLATRSELQCLGMVSYQRQIGIYCLFLLLAIYKGDTSSSETTQASTSLLPSTTHHANRNCTSRLVGDVYLPCQPDSCFYRNASSRSEGGHVEPCLPGNHDIMMVNHFSEYKLNNLAHNASLPLNRWLLLKNTNGECMNILTVKDTDTVCVMPGFCDSEFPWYVRLSETPSTSFGVETQAHLCMTDVTSLDKAVCCKQPIRVRIRSCDFYWIYNVVEPMPVSAAGNLCVQKNSDSHDITRSVSSFNTQYTIEGGQLLPKRLDALTNTELESVCTAVLKFEVPDIVEYRDLVDVLNSEIVIELNKYLEREANRNSNGKIASPATANIYRIVGSPEYISSTNRFYYTIYAKTDSGELISQSALLNAIDMCDNTKFSKWFTYIRGSARGIPSGLSYPYVATTTMPVTTTPQAVESSIEERSDWKIIIYIITATIFIIVLAFLFLCVYRLKLLHSLRSNRSMSFSKFERWLLCEKYPADNEINLSLKRDGPPVALLNSYCNGYGKHHTRRDQSDPVNDRATQN